jgi:hypothetical protein
LPPTSLQALMLCSMRLGTFSMTAVGGSTESTGAGRASLPASFAG